MNNNRCASCGVIIPEGRQVCPLCDRRQIRLGMILQSIEATTDDVKAAYAFMEGTDDVTLSKRDEDKASAEE